jgi:heterodisulfide reductase subunit D
MFKKLLDKILGMVSNTLYYPGCLTKYSEPFIQENYEKLLKKLEIDYILLKEQELCCGSPALRAGYKQDFNDIKKKNLELFRQYGVARIITNCPACYHMLKTEYGLNVEHITQTVMKNLSRFDKDRFKGERITYHDPCHLGRYSDIYDEPRKILEYLGFEVVELRDNREKSLCCGGGGGLRGYNLEVARKIAKLRLKGVKTKKIITPCPMCYSHLKESAKDTGIEVLEFSEVLV